jgi:hypothetical protein
MIHRRRLLTVSAVGALWLGNGAISTTDVHLVARAEAVVGAPVTPVSYAGVARRSTVGVGAPGVGVTPGVGVGAPGVGATPVPGVGTPANRGGPVNRVGVR